MKITRLVLKNFRSYEEETEFNFNTTNENNIILIGGKNGAGKSTIFESIKLCIYGPLAYKYQGFNSNYIHKVKANINNNAIKNDKVDSFVAIDIELDENTEKNVYTLTRKWTFNNRKLNETFTVSKNNSDVLLNEEELTYFENYLKSIVPPNIFEFFFFDGEDLSDFFIGKNSKTHLKQSILSLCNYDTFDILKTFILSNSRKNLEANNLNEIDTQKQKYMQLEFDLHGLKENRDDILFKIENEINRDIDDLNVMKKELETSFRKRGGLLADEVDSLNKEQSEIEQRRGVINQTIKNFCNEMLPFLMLKDKLPSLSKQIDNENKNVVYSKIKNKLNDGYISNILRSKLNDNNTINDLTIALSEALLSDIKPDIDDESFEVIHNLSNVDSNTVLSNIVNVMNFNPSDILNLFKEIKSLSKRAAKIRSKLQTSLDNKELENYIKDLSHITDTLSAKLEEKNELQNELDKIKVEITKTESDKEKARKNYIKLLQSNNVVDLSAKIMDLLDDIILKLTKQKVIEIQDNFMFIFKKLMRKDNFINDININNNYNVTLYVNKTYNSHDIENMLDNIGYDEMLKKLGEKFFSDLFKQYNVTDKNELLNKLKLEPMYKYIDLKTKVDINNLSNGEKQIYILCLYWSLIKASGMEIPFVIDTPYARIDETHRNNITSDYFPTISNQVIILSTNTEIDENAYKQIKSKINHEYLIQYDDKKRKTNKSEGYFYEV